MPELLLYLLKVNIALVLFYLAYHVALRRLTFYHLNRLFLVFGIVFSTVYPFIDISELFADNDKITSTYIATIPVWVITAQTAAPAPEAFDYWQLPVYLFWAGVIVMLVRFILQLVSLYRIHAASEPAKYKSIGFRQVKSISQAFSFWQTIYINPASHKTEELESILHHELIHITGWHTLDVMLAELSTVFYWFNPGAWLMKKAVKENLEFIADQNVVSTGVDKKEYQYLLLKVVGATQPQIANQFNFPSLKRRIAMMNKMPSTKKHLLKFLAVVPVAALLLLAFNMVTPSKANNLITGELGAYTRVGPDIYIKKAPTFKAACWFAPNTLSITTIAGEEESYQLDNEKDLAVANSKYGLYMPDHEKYNKISVDALKGIKQEFPDGEVSYETFYARNPQVNEVAWLSGGKIMIKLKSGMNEVFRFDNKQDMAIAEMTYGKLPSAPPVVVRDNPAQQDGKVPKALIEYLKKNKAIKNVRTQRINGKDALVLNLRGGGTEVYYLGDAESIANLEHKYGLPELPPPPPPVPANEELPPPPPPAPEAPALPPPPPPVRHVEGKLTGLPEGVIYYIDGKEDKQENYKKLDADQIYSINVYKGDKAVETFGKKASKGVVSIVTEQNKASKQVQEFQKKLPALPAPPPPPVRVSERSELPPPPPPVKNDKPLVPTPGAKMVEDSENVTYILWPSDVWDNREFEVAEEAFEKNGFNLKFKKEYKAGKLSDINITLASKKLNKGTSNSYNLDELHKNENVVVVRGNKQTGEVMIVTTIPAK